MSYVFFHANDCLPLQEKVIASRLAALKDLDKAPERAKMAAVNNLLSSGGKDVLSDWLDSCKGDTVTDHSIFSKLSRHYEAEYHADMRRLNVQDPDVLTRVSEFVPEVVEYIQKIIENGYAYAANGSVYFDTEAFGKRHFYAKLVPEAFSDAKTASAALAEGEGELSVAAAESEKRHGFDFALWKSSKPGEPAWKSPWGMGRPGWHIECSVMASAICGDKLDIHAGGFDLKFPHHDNEIAQAEAFLDSGPWVNYFLHAGTLRIRGLKMSKSLKNFITIDACLQKYTASQLRMLFLLHHWTDVLDYSESTMERALAYERTFSEYRMLIEDIVRRDDGPASWSKASEADLELAESLITTRAAIHEALCDSVDTKTVLGKLRDLVSEANVYINHAEANSRDPYVPVIREINDLVQKMLGIFGVTGQESEDSAGSKEEHVLPYLDVLSDFR